MASKDSKEEYISTYEEDLLVFKMVSTDFGLWQEYWGEEYMIEAYYSDYPERHPSAKYVSQLIEDLREISENNRLEDLLDRLDYYDDYRLIKNLGNEYLDKYNNDLFNKKISSEKEGEPFITTLQELTGIDKAFLPPKDKLCPEHIMTLSMEIDLFLGHFEIFISTPNYIQEFNYLVIRDYWDKPLNIEDAFNDFTWEDKMDRDVASW